MPLFIVKEKSTGKIVHRYISDTIEVWQGFELETHDHILQEEATVVKEVPVLEWDTLTFLKRFDRQERINIFGARSTDANLNDFFLLLEHAGRVHSTDPETIKGLGYLVYKGWITPTRKDEILGVI